MDLLLIPPKSQKFTDNGGDFLSCGVDSIILIKDSAAEIPCPSPADVSGRVPIAFAI
jgi:hypothetical protein